MSNPEHSMRQCICKLGWGGASTIETKGTGLLLYKEKEYTRALG